MIRQLGAKELLGGKFRMRAVSKSEKRIFFLRAIAFLRKQFLLFFALYRKQFLQKLLSVESSLTLKTCQS